jgi:hypothetical protein
MSGYGAAASRTPPHIRRIVVLEKPVSAAIERIDQCVASTGVVCNVFSITAVI